MLRRILAIAGAMALAFAPVSPARGAQDSDAGSNRWQDSLVLVLNIISTTHARPVTGVVLAGRGDRGTALVLVPADSVSAGDEIVVLDGGTDILRNGRPSRTVARSAETGVAVLEVDGLQRAGVGLSTDAGPPPADAMLEFAAWPAAADLVDGAGLVRRSVRPQAAGETPERLTAPELPNLGGPLFDRCGGLVAFHLTGSEYLVEAPSIAGLLASAGIEVAASSCYPAPGDGPTDDAGPSELDPEPGPGPSSDISVADPMVRKTTPDTGGGERPRAVQPAWLAAAVLLGIIMGVIYLRRRSGPKGNRILLQEVGSGDGAMTHEIRFKPGSDAALFEVDGHALAFQLGRGRVLLSHRGDEADHVALAIGGAPCLPGETFTVKEGDEIHVGNAVYRLRMELLAPAGDGQRDE